MADVNMGSNERTPLLPRPLRAQAKSGPGPERPHGNTLRPPGRDDFGRAPFRRKTPRQEDAAAPSTTDVETGLPAQSGPTCLRNDPRRDFVKTLLERVEFSDSRIDRESLSKGQTKLLDALHGEPMTGGVDEDLPMIMIYKGRPLITARVLHLAVWCSAQLHEASLVDLVLSYSNAGDVFDKAKYELPSRKQGWSVELELDPLHIACGFGSLCAVTALVRHVTNLRGMGGFGSSPGSVLCSPGKPMKATRDYVNIWAVKRHTKVNPPTDSDKAEKGECRLENFYCPIHEATNNGFLDVARYLLTNGADGAIPNTDGVMPLHFVALRGSACGLRTGDTDTLRKVVVALQEAGGSLEGRVNRQHYNAKLAGKLPLELAASDDSRFPRQMMGLLVPCLQDNSVSEPRFFADIAFLTTLDAEAAADVVREIRARALKNQNVLQRFRLDAQRPGRTDFIAGILFLAPEAGGEMLDMLVGDPLVQDCSKHNIPTRTSLWGFWRHLNMRCVYKGDAVEGDNHVLLPQWSFKTDCPIEKQPEIAWHNWLVPETPGLALRQDYVYNVSVSTVLLPNILDLDMFVALSRVLRTQMKVFSKLSVQGMISCLWFNLVDPVWVVDLAFQVFELFVLMWWSLAWPLQGPRGAIKADKAFCWAVITAGVFREFVGLCALFQSCLLKYKSHEDPSLRSMWHPFSGPFVHWSLPKVALLVLQMRFALESRRDLDDGSELTEIAQVLLACTVLIKATQVTYLFRLCAGGSKIYAIFYSFFGGATREMISITGMIFVSFSLAFLVLAKEKSAGWVLASSYRGLLFGDGDGFNNLGMDVHEDGYQNNNQMLMMFLILGSFFFNVILMNLIIAVYGNEYDKVAGETPQLFLHGRAQSCVMYILTNQVFPWMGHGVNVFLKACAFGLVCLGMGWHFTRDHQYAEWSTAVSVALGQIIFQGAQMQCDWFSLEGIAADGKEHFLWICHRDLMESDVESETLQVGHFEDRLAEVKKHVDARMNSIEEKLDSLFEVLRGQ